jgi:hypothetical protein
MFSIPSGMTKSEVLSLLGEPDDVITEADPEPYSNSIGGDIWGYGCNGHLTLPTLGYVFFNRDDKVDYNFRGGEAPPSPALISETELRLALRTIDEARSPLPWEEGWEAGPLAIIRIADRLWPLGKQRVLAAFREYAQIRSHDAPVETLAGVLRLLFPGQPRKEDLEDAGEGLSHPDGRFPYIVVGDIPLQVRVGFFGSGPGPLIEPVLDYYEKFGILRAGPVRPDPDPAGLLERLPEGPHWKALPIGREREQRSALTWPSKEQTVADMQRQIRQLLRSVLPPNLDENDDWLNVKAAIAKTGLRWDPLRRRYTRKDGSFIPEPRPLLPVRRLWHPRSLVEIDGRFVIQRNRKDHLYVGFRRDSRRNPDLKARLEILDGSSVVATISLPKGDIAPAGRWGYSMSPDAIGVTTNLSEKAELRLRVRRGNSSEISPTFFMRLRR